MRRAAAKFYAFGSHLRIFQRFLARFSAPRPQFQALLADTHSRRQSCLAAGQSSITSTRVDSRRQKLKLVMEYLPGNAGTIRERHEQPWQRALAEVGSGAAMILAAYTLDIPV